MKVFSVIKRICSNPASCWVPIRGVVLNSRLVMQIYHRICIPILIQVIKRKKYVNVVFLAMNPDMWRYDNVFRRLKHDTRFHPVIVTAMRTNASMKERIEEQGKMVSFFENRGFEVVQGYDTRGGMWIDLKSLKPDMIFHTQPYDGMIEPSLSFYNHLLCLHCYTPYFFQTEPVKWEWDNLLQNYCWREYFAGVHQIDMCKRFSRIKGINSIPAGYCLEEEFSEIVSKKTLIEANWRHDKRKRIIWAPHHSILPKEMFKVSSFLEICDLMVKIREEYAETVIFAFKPHPMLKSKLYSVWGQERTDAYYADWATSANSFDAQGNYQALFAGSDAMIHCSGSFVLEYLYTNKPVQYVYSKTRTPPELGDIYQAALSVHYPARSESDIRKFLNEVVLAQRDTMKTDRGRVVDQYLKSPNKKHFSENVYNDIVKGLWR